MDDVKAQLPDDHCDNYLESPDTPDALLTFLLIERAPAFVRNAVERVQGRPNLFATLRSTGRRVRVCMASRMGNLGYCSTSSKTRHYEDICWVKDLTHFDIKP